MDVVGAEVEVAAVEGTVMRPGRMEQVVVEIRVIYNASNATNMGIMQIIVQMQRRKRRHIMFVQKRGSNHKHSCLLCLKELFQVARGRVCFYMKGRCCRSYI